MLVLGNAAGFDLATGYEDHNREIQDDSPRVCILMNNEIAYYLKSRRGDFVSARIDKHVYKSLPPLQVWFRRSMDYTYLVTSVWSV